MSRPEKIPKAVISVGVLRKPVYLRLMLTSEGRDAWGVYCALLTAARDRNTHGKFLDSTEASQLSGVPQRAIESAISVWKTATDRINQVDPENPSLPWISFNQNMIILKDWCEWNTRPRGGRRAGSGAPLGNQNASRHTTNAQSKSKKTITSSASASTSASKKQQPSPSGNNGPPADFVEFWNHYPRKIGKGAALKVWKRMNAADRKEAIEQAEAYSQAYNQAPDARRQFFKHPTTWLNARGWEDDHGEWRLLIEGK